MQRFFEMIPGGLTWLTFVLIIMGAWKAPFLVSLFFILYSLYWLVRLIYLHLHLRSAFSTMRENMRINWLSRVESLQGEGQSQSFAWSAVRHLVMLPMYKEPYSLVEETFEKLIAAQYPLKNICIVLATEERAGEEAFGIARRIEEKYKNNFLAFLVTKHPKDIVGEIPGKGSNESWAAEEARKLILDELHIPYDRVVVSVFDIDTRIEPQYFGRLTHAFLTSPHPQRASFQPIPLFLNNIFEVPSFSRVMAFFPTFWQMMQQSRFEQLTTFTSQAMPFLALHEVGYWDKNLVSEDSLIFWKFYFHFNGDWRTEPLYYPVSMDANLGSTAGETAKHLYLQQRRWAWGAENIPYMLRGFRGNKKIPLRKKIIWLLIFLEGFWSWTTSPFILFILGWLPLFIGGYAFNASVLSYNLPKVTWPILNLSTLGIMISAFFSTALLPKKPLWFRWYHYVAYVLEWLLVPIVIIIFSAIPGVDAQTRLMLGGKFRLGFWPTPKEEFKKRP